MKKRELIVDNAEKALKSMLAMLAANMIDNELDNCEATEKGVELQGVKYPVKLVWLERGDNDLVGCPCFACNFNGMLPTGAHIKAVVYVKAFAARTFTMCKMHMLKDEGNVKCREIADGDSFVMNDNSKGYGEETYLYKNGKISFVK